MSQCDCSNLKSRNVRYEKNEKNSSDWIQIDFMDVKRAAAWDDL